MSLPEPLAAAVATHIGTVRRAAPVGGGCIAHATRLDAEAGTFFLKYGSAEVSRTFTAEAAGLRALRRAASPLVIPDVLAAEAATDARPGYLLLDWIEPGAKGPAFWKDFGRGLASLHRHTADAYGFDADNYIGSTPQRNIWEQDWPTFFREHRLMPQAALARRQGRWQGAWDAPFDALLRRLDAVLPATPPASILHGDLWSGNFLATASGTAALIDPAAYYGHRETDLALTELFGGFDARFYDAYRAAWPLEPGYPARREIYDLYHLLNHLNLFGGSYAGAVGQALNDGR